MKHFFNDFFSLSVSNSPLGHFHNLSFIHLDEDFLVFLDDILPSQSLSLRDDSIFDLKKKYERKMWEKKLKTLVKLFSSIFSSINQSVTLPRGQLPVSDYLVDLRTHCSLEVCKETASTRQAVGFDLELSHSTCMNTCPTLADETS